MWGRGMEPEPQRLAHGHHEIALDERAGDGHAMGHREGGPAERAGGFNGRSHGNDDRPTQLLARPVVAPGLAKARGRRIVGVVHPPGVYRESLCADPG